MVITKQYILDNRTPRGSWTKSQMRAIGVDWPQPKGWIVDSIGKEITERNAEIFESKIRARQEKPDLEKAYTCITKHMIDLSTRRLMNLIEFATIEKNRR